MALPSAVAGAWPVAEGRGPEARRSVRVRLAAVRSTMRFCPQTRARLQSLHTIKTHLHKFKTHWAAALAASRPSPVEGAPPHTIRMMPEAGARATIGGPAMKP